MVAVLENQLPAHLAARVFGHHHNIRRIAGIGRKPSFCGPFRKSIECVREAGGIPGLFRAYLHNDFRHEAPEVPTPLAAAVCSL